MKKRFSIALAVFVILLTNVSHAYDPIPADCSGTCTTQADCEKCMSSCGGYIGKYANVTSFLEALMAGLTPSDPNVDPKVVQNLQACWCLDCCVAGSKGNTTHPCIFPCPCGAPGPNATTTTNAGTNTTDFSFKGTIGELINRLNYSTCAVLNILWLLIGAVSALVLIFAGIQYLTQEEPTSRNKAKAKIFLAIGGILIAVIACPAIDYLIAGTNILPINASCQCYKMMDFKPNPAPTLPPLVTIVTRPWPTSTAYVTTTTRGPTTTKSTATSSSTSTTSTTSTTLGPCDDFKKSGKLPASWDWKNVNGKDYVIGVRDQSSPHQCGSCWAHGTCGAMEGTINVEKDTPGTDRNLAEQYLVSTCFPPADCGGLSPSDIPTLFAFLKTDGVPDEACYPYLAANSQCSGRCSDYASRTRKITTYGHAVGDNNVKGALICYGPMFTGSDNWGHVVTLVGYNAQGWIIKNSWGTGWSSGGQPGGFGVINYGSSYSDLSDHAYWVDGMIVP